MEERILTNQFKNEKIRFSERNLKSVLDKFELKKIDELFLKIGKGELAPITIILSLFPEKEIVESNEKIVLLNEVKEKENPQLILRV